MATVLPQSMLYSIDQFLVRDGLVHLRGWAFVPGARVESVELCFPSGAKFPVASYGQASLDVAAELGEAAAQVRFDEEILANEPVQDAPSAWLVVSAEGLPPAVIKNLGTPRPLYSIDRFSALDGFVRLTGWAFVPGARVESVELCFPSGARFPVTGYGQPSADVAAAYGEVAAQVRFDEAILTNQPLEDVPSAWLEVTVEGLPPVSIKNLGAPRPHDSGVQTHNEFVALLRERPSGHVLEIGSRPRFGGGRKKYLPAGWSYTGLDIQAGENVDVVGDAHKLSRLFPTTRFDAVASFSVLEHLMMPWKFVVELNKVLNPGAIGFFTTHQCWPMHDVPWDYWRFSDTAWASLFNRMTGFEILRIALEEPAFIVPERLHPATNFGTHGTGFLASSVLFRKVGDTTLDWPVEIEDITDTQYPKGD